MEPIKKFSGRTVALPINDIDTDQIIPARYLKVTDKSGLGAACFEDWRYNADGSPKPEFPLNKPEHNGAKVLIGGHNFGCGSSREHAPWALVDYGFRAIIAPSFADIFSNNSLKNGLLAVTLSDEEVDELMRRARDIELYQLTVNLEDQTVSDGQGFSARFKIDDFQRSCLLQGLDDIGLTLQHQSEITTYEDQRPAWLA